MEQVENNKMNGGSGIVAKITSKFLGAVFGYMFIGLLLTAIVSFGFSWFIAANYVTNGEISETGATILLAMVIGSAILSYIVILINNIYSLKTGKAPWVGFIVYAICMGITFSVILLAGIDFGTIGEAFGLTALAFGVMFLIGYFAKTDLSPLVFVAIALLLCIVMVSAFWFIFYLINPAAFSWLNVGISVAIILYCLIMVAIEANRIGKIAEKGQGNNNLALFCAFTLYTDFIAIFIKILFLILASKSRK